MKHLLFIGRLLPLFLLLMGCKHGNDLPTGPNTPISETLAMAPQGTGLVTTVANIIRTETGVTYHFNERQARYFVASNHPSYNEMLRVASEAQVKKLPIKIETEGHNQLNRLDWPTESETKAYLDWYRGNFFLEAGRPLNVDDISPTIFNHSSWQNWKAFRLCIKAAPNYAKAVEIFNYCAAQICQIGPTQVSPCIPFGYVRDGCFARAHKMRWIIENKYGYCSEKVFSYGNLDVKANKWGGCCVGWWYHVAPLIRVKSTNGSILCYVIDPGMFNAPVLLSEWLAAQEAAACDAGANVDSYSIQPSTAYTPGFNGEYTTDPNYTLTNNDLVYYASWGPTCP
jgi:Glutaminase